MIIFQEATTKPLPALSQSSLFMKFNEQSNLAQVVKDAIADREHYVKPDSVKEIMSLMRLNGSPIAKKAVQKFEDGKMILIYNKEQSKIPAVLPYIVIKTKQGIIPVVFVDRVVTNISSSNEYVNLMATMEAAYLAASLRAHPNTFLLNRQLILNLCKLYNYLWIMPLEQKLYMKGENLTKAELYITTYFYRMIDGDRATSDTIPFHQILSDKTPATTLKQIVTEVQLMPSMAFGNLIELIKQINPVRYKDLNATFMTYFTSSCGIPLIFALENIEYLFLLITSANYKTKITAYALNKTATNDVRKCMSILNAMDITY